MMDKKLQTLPENNPVETSGEVIKPKSKTVFWVLGALIILALGVALGVFISKRMGTGINVMPENLKTDVDQKPSPNTKKELVSGEIRVLAENLKLFKESEEEKINGVAGNEIYYEAGKFSQGKYEGYSRILALKPNWGPGDPHIYKLATKDFEQFILDDPESYANLPADDWRNPFAVLDKSKVTATDVLEDGMSKIIDLDSEYSLFEEGWPVEYVDTNRKDSNGNVISELKLIEDFSSYKLMTPGIEGLELRLKPNLTKNIDYTGYPEKERSKQETMLKMFPYRSQVVVIDKTGLPKLYSMALKTNAYAYAKLKSDYDKKVEEYNRLSEKYNAKEISELPSYPEPVALPGMGFYSSELEKSAGGNYFNHYSAAFPDVCSNSSASWVVNIKNEDLIQTSKLGKVAVYKLKDGNHPLYKLAYDNKMDYYQDEMNGWDEVNKGMKKPTFEEYKLKNPLLFVKDYWSQWVVLGEYDILMPGGCGKPVIYLYPEKETVVTVKLLNKTDLAVDIPRYSNGWKVLAGPEGQLKDLQTEMTDCSLINFDKKGSEYARNACVKGIYPYLYWSGKVEGVDYPQIEKRSVVKKKELAQFFDRKLGEAGFRDREIEDFKEYWIPKMEESNKNYFSVGFLQTEELNHMFSMAVEPKPDTVIRIFMDYQPLEGKPDGQKDEAKLKKIQRKGFTLVEWGGKVR